MKKEPIQVTPSWGNDKWSDHDSGAATSGQLNAAVYSAFDLWWNDMDNGCPTLVLDNDEEFAISVWNAALDRALLSLPGGNICDPQAAADAIRELIQPNSNHSNPEP